MSNYTMVHNFKIVIIVFIFQKKRLSIITTGSDPVDYSAFDQISSNYANQPAMPSQFIQSQPPGNMINSMYNSQQYQQINFQHGPYQNCLSQSTSQQPSSLPANINQGFSSPPNGDSRPHTPMGNSVLFRNKSVSQERCDNLGAEEPSSSKVRKLFLNSENFVPDLNYNYFLILNLCIKLTIYI